MVFLASAYGGTLEEAFVSGNAQQYFFEKTQQETLEKDVEQPIFQDARNIFKLIFDGAVKNTGSQKPFRFMQVTVNVKFKGEMYIMEIDKKFKPSSYIFLTDNFKNEILEFLGWPEELHASRNSRPMRKKNETEKRLEFINNYVSVHFDEDREEYMFTIYPMFSFVKITDDKKEAAVRVRMQGAWVNVDVIKSGNGWEILAISDRSVE